MESRCYLALRAEAFLIALNPWLAAGALAVGVVFWLWRWARDPEFHFRRLPYDVPVFLFVLFAGASVAVAPNRLESFYNYYVCVGLTLLRIFLPDKRCGRRASFAASCVRWRSRRFVPSCMGCTNLLSESKPSI